MQMQPVTVFSSGCPSCVEATDILQQQGIQAHVVDVQADPNTKAHVVNVLKAHGIEESFPQIAVGNNIIGGLDALKTAISTDQLSKLMTATKKPCCRGLPDDECSDMHRGASKTTH
jgi:glutaredoxin